MAITWTDVTNLDAKLASVPVASQSAILALVYQLLSSAAFGTDLDLAAKFFAAHLGILITRGTISGLITSESLGDAARSYSVMGQGMLFDTTVWGQMLSLMMRRVGSMVVL